jgi:hypothetical protein
MYSFLIIDWQKSPFWTFRFLKIALVHELNAAMTRRRVVLVTIVRLIGKVKEIGKFKNDFSSHSTSSPRSSLKNVNNAFKSF